MKKTIFAFALFLFLVACNNDANNTTATQDSAGENPSAIDSGSQHPNGMTNGSVISTDTSAMNMNKANNANGDSTTRR